MNSADALASALRSIRNLFAASSVLIVVWLLSLPAVEEKLTLRNACMDLHAWLVLQNQVCDSLHSPGPLWYTLREWKTGDSDIAEIPFAVDLIWPSSLTDTLTLQCKRFKVKTEGKDSIPLFVLEPTGTTLPVDAYRILTYQQQSWVEPSTPGLDSIVTNWHHHPFRFSKVPQQWDIVRPYIRRYGEMSTLGPWTLDGHKDILLSVAEECDIDSAASGVSVLGIELSLKVYFLSIGLLLGLLGFGLLGPLHVVLRLSTDHPEATTEVLSSSHWILSSSWLGWESVGTFLLWARVLILGLWSIAPTGILLWSYLTLVSQAGLEVNWYTAVFVTLNVTGSLLASFIFGGVAWTLQSLRRGRSLQLMKILLG